MHSLATHSSARAEGSSLPASVVLGRANLTAQMKGSHLAPVIDVGFKLEVGSGQGRVKVKLI
jgi:hypothetical protein